MAFVSLWHTAVPHVSTRAAAMRHRVDLLWVINRHSSAPRGAERSSCGSFERERSEFQSVLIVETLTANSTITAQRLGQAAYVFAHDDHVSSA
jgi:hypothetical protein